jgi:hypothetical protein
VIGSGKAIEPSTRFEQAVRRALNIRDDKVAREMWSALANVEWINEDGESVGYSFRRAGALIADIRDNGDYMDWYCCGPTSFVSDEIRYALGREGWRPSIRNS